MKDFATLAGLSLSQTYALIADRKISVMEKAGPGKKRISLEEWERFKRERSRTKDRDGKINNQETNQ